LAGCLLELPAEPLDDATWNALLATVRSQRLTGQLADALAGDVFAATEVQEEEALNAHTHAMALVLRLDRLLLSVVELLSDRGIDARILKGAAVAHLDYPDPALRSYGDVDVLVATADFEAAVDALGGLGFTRRIPELRRGFDGRFGKGSALVGPQGFEIDLHRTFVPGRFGLTIPLDELFSEWEPFSVGGVELRALSNVNRLLHACFHATIGDAEPRIVPQRDVVQLVLGSEDSLDEVLQRAAEWRCEAVVSRAVGRSWELFGLADKTPLSVWAARYIATPQDERALRAYIGTHRMYSRQALGGLPAVRGILAKAAYLRALVRPDRAASDHLGGGNLRRIIRTARVLVSGKARRS
jgi:hypothetical protein